MRLALLEAKMEEEHRKGAEAALANKKKNLRPISCRSEHCI